VAELLLEIGVEEIPDWMIDAALTHLRDEFSKAAGALNGTIELLDATPRRLALIATGLDTQLPDIEQVIPGPYISAGEKAAQGFAKKNNTTIEALIREADAKGERYYFSSLKRGESAAALFARVLPELITGIPWPKTMYWTGKEGLRFIRPIRWIVALLDGSVIPFQIANVPSSNTTRGHRVLGSNQPLPVTVSTYEKVLHDNGVIVRALDRKARIETGLGPDVLPDPGLLGALVYLTEHPSPIRGAFDPLFLELPKEILSTVMRHHQRYFSVLNADGSLAPAFVAVTNTDGDPDGLIRQGNERVLRARFNDARFFWRVDQQRPLGDRLEDLAKVTFQAKLGSYKEKTMRVVDLASDLARRTGADLLTTERAALLAKCDLTTDMVKEFTELQGVVGGLYARAQGESEAVALAIYDHYKPVSMEDSIPRTLAGQMVAIADKLDTLRECFKIGLIPSGSKDPFALRRAAQGIVKILFEAKLPIDLDTVTTGIPQLTEFMLERIEFYLREILHYEYDEVNAVLARPVTTLADLAGRAEAVHTVRPTEDFEPLAASFKRIKNILKQAGVTSLPSPNPAQLTPGPERELYEASERVRTRVSGNTPYREKLTAIASLRPKVDLFFDKILVNDPDPVIRENRLALLSSLLTESSTVADFSEIVTKGAGA
jgi:glycyl-tRNA synthetase beta chain